MKLRVRHGIDAPHLLVIETDEGLQAFIHGPQLDGKWHVSVWVGWAETFITPSPEEAELLAHKLLAPIGFSAHPVRN